MASVTSREMKMAHVSDSQPIVFHIPTKVLQLRLLRRGDNPNALSAHERNPSAPPWAHVV
jgi:hypothetical protein